MKLLPALYILAAVVLAQAAEDDAVTVPEPPPAKLAYSSPPPEAGIDSITPLSDYHGFSASCTDIRLSKAGGTDWNLYATCRRINGSVLYDTFGMNSCVTNVNGVL